MEKKKSMVHCSPFCFELIEQIDPELILLHGLDVAKFFSNYCKWGTSENAGNKDIHGLIKNCNGRTFVLSRHLASIKARKDEAWKALEEAAKKLEKTGVLKKSK